MEKRVFSHEELMATGGFLRAGDTIPLLGRAVPDLTIAKALGLIYVAGPFRGANVWEMECKIRHAERVSLAVWAAGYVAICPHLNTRFFQGRLPDETFIDGTLAMMLACDAMLVLPTWKSSEGTKGEILSAAAECMPFRVLEWDGEPEEVTIDWAVRRALISMEAEAAERGMAIAKAVV